MKLNRRERRKHLQPAKPQTHFFDADGKPIKKPESERYYRDGR